MSSNSPQTVTIATPQSKNNPQDVAVEEIPLPPIEMWKELDNTPPPPVPAAAAAEDDAAVDEIADLDFVGETHRKVIPLRHSFTRNGTTVTTITVRRLRIGDVDRFIKRARKGSFSTFDVYAEMTRLPAAVLRGLIDEDGDAVTDACFDFLPPPLRPEPEPRES